MKLIRISNRQIIDVVRFSDDKAILVEKLPKLGEDNYTVNYFILNFNDGQKEIVTKDAYLLKKFGPMRKEISEKLGNFVTCGAMILQDRRVMVVYPTGDTGLFDNEGNLVRDGLLTYNDNPVSCIAQDGEYFWSVCEKENSVIRFYADGAKTDIRIGGREQATFTNPHFVSADDDYVYVCCNRNSVRRIDKKNLSVSDINRVYDGITGYYKFGKFAIVTTFDGAYCDKD